MLTSKLQPCLLKSESHPPKKTMFFLFHRNPFKNDQKCFLFHLKSSFRSQNIKILVLTLIKNALIKKTMLILKFKMSQSGYQTVTIHI